MDYVFISLAYNFLPQVPWGTEPRKLVLVAAVSDSALTT
jgi:hypothetical protein